VRADSSKYSVNAAGRRSLPHHFLNQLSLQLGILLSLVCALATNLGFLLKHRGACAAPAVSLRHPIASAAGLFCSKWFTIGLLVAIVAWILHVAALALAPLSIVQAVISGGLVFLTVIAERWFGANVGLRQWAGVGLTALGLVLLAVTLPSGGGAHSSYSLAGMIAFESALLALGTFLVLSPQLDSHEHHGVMLGTAAGILFGVSDVAIKALTGSVGASGMAGLVSPWLVTCILASVIAFFASARGLQKGEAVPVITLTSAAANVTAISGGILVFGDPMPGDPLGIVLQSFAFVLVIVAAALTPAPLRAARTAA
jgi:drug/metabolite transporter (DMT)-like permease